jgi:hypothetical protein
MSTLTRHLRGLVVALAVLALTAGGVLAARALPTAPPPAAASGLQVATDASGHAVPVRAETPTSPDADEDADQDGDGAEAPDEDAPDTDPSDAARAQNHGWFVSQAAAAETPAGFANHGAYVSSIAKGDDGKPAAATKAADKAAKAAKAAKGAATAAAAKAKAAERKAAHGG